MRIIEEMLAPGAVVTEIARQVGSRILIQLQSKIAKPVKWRGRDAANLREKDVPICEPTLERALSHSQWQEGIKQQIHKRKAKS
jgi:hypothetical protein